MKAKTYIKPHNATCTPEFADMIDKAFSPITPYPGMSIEEIMFHAGQRSVVDKVKDYIRSSVQDNQINRTID